MGRTRSPGGSAARAEQVPGLRLCGRAIASILSAGVIPMGVAVE